MTNMGTLVPDTTSLKDMLGINVEIEEFLKATEGTKSVDPSERLQHWLNSPLPIPVVEAVVEDSGDDGDDDSGLVQ